MFKDGPRFFSKFKPGKTGRSALITYRLLVAKTKKSNAHALTTEPGSFQLGNWAHSHLMSIWHRAFISSNFKQTPPNQKVSSEKKQLGRPGASGQPLTRVPPPIWSVAPSELQQT